MSHLSKTTKLGGLGLPLLLPYYVASQLRTLYTYLHGCKNKSWAQIKEMLMTPYDLQDITWNKTKERPKMIWTNPFLTITLKIWDNFYPIFTSHIFPIFSFLCHSWFSSCCSPQSFPIWRQNNIYRLKDILHNGKMIIKQQLEETHVVIIPWYQYFQTHYMVFSLMYWILLTSNVLNIDLTSFELLMCATENHTVSLISMIYKMLNTEEWANIFISKCLE